MDLNRFYNFINHQGEMLSQIDVCRREQSDITRLRNLVDNTPAVIFPQDICLAKNGRVNIKFNNIEFECILNKRESSDELMVSFLVIKMKIILCLYLEDGLMRI